jgi:hypothetical protein
MPARMKLQMRARADKPWRTVVEFEPVRWPEVHDAAASLWCALGGAAGAQWRTVRDGGRIDILTDSGAFREVARDPSDAAQAG